MDTKLMYNWKCNMSSSLIYNQSHYTCDGIKIIYIYIYIYITVTKKERVRKHTAQRLLSTNPGVHACLNHSTQLRPPKMYTSLTVCWILTRSKTRKSFALTHPQSRFHNMCPLTRSFTQSSTKGEHSGCIANLHTFRKHKLSFSPMFAETRAC
jgi:hypothetical protein